MKINKEGVKQMKSKNLRILLPVLVIIISFLGLGGCKKFGIPDFKLTIIFEDGVQGTPGEGEYIHEELAAVDYSYTAIESGYYVEVMVNEGRWESQGTFTVFTDTSVVVRLIDIRDTWSIELTAEDVDDKDIDVTFTGSDMLSGEFTDSEGHSGIWNIDDKTLNMVYNDWADYALTGDISTMSGDWSGSGVTGEWRAVRKVTE
ncbi:MAG: hypothetical protein GY765_38630 [bacterium]|nr:hypothetical protein [bacterium]